MAKATHDQLMAFANELSAVLTQAGISRKHLAAAFDVTTQAVDYWITGQREPDLRTLAALETYLGAQGRFVALLGYDPAPTGQSGRWQTPPTESDIHLAAASDPDLEELASEDPEAYQAILAQARIALDRARARRPR